MSATCVTAVANSRWDGICNPIRFSGYRLPKDTKQPLGNFYADPQNFVHTFAANTTTREELCTAEILKLKRNPKLVVIHRQTMKAGSDNCRRSFPRIMKGDQCQICDVR